MPNIIKLSSPETKEFWQIPVLHEDADLLVLDKPAGPPTSPARDNPDRPDLMKLLHRDIARGAPWVIERNLTYLANTHRLDAETTGVLVLAKNKAALVHVANQFGGNQSSHTYIAILQGMPENDEWITDAKILPHPLNPGVVRVDLRGGKKSVTEFEMITCFRGYALVRCRAITDRLHQIRVHARWCKHPIVGDAKYGGNALYLSKIKRAYEFKKDEEERPLVGRTALHSETITFTQPTNGQPLELTADLAKDLSIAVKYLKRFAGM